MAYTLNRTRPVGIPARTSLAVGGLVSRINAWNETRRTRNALSRLSAHELNDIGLTRGDIDRLSGTRF